MNLTTVPCPVCAFESTATYTRLQKPRERSSNRTGLLVSPSPLPLAMPLTQICWNRECFVILLGDVDECTSNSLSIGDSKLRLAMWARSSWILAARRRCLIYIYTGWSPVKYYVYYLVLFVMCMLYLWINVLCSFWNIFDLDNMFGLLLADKGGPYRVSAQLRTWRNFFCAEHASRRRRTTTMN
jgi:hypothetical protein